MKSSPNSEWAAWGRCNRASDTKLKRQVAIKILPASLAFDADKLARFQREAEVLASLNHPNIAAIYGLEESEGLKALVMELVEGLTLAGRIAEGPISINEALPIAKQIAEALEAAHEQGIIHRDLKPANIKLRPDGTVKVLDFGLAKAMEPAVATSSNQSMSPTITTPAMTQMGMLLGTAAYMSPEQAKGRAADKRSDIWAFGCVLYEMLTGSRAFNGEDLTETLAAVVRGEPDLAALPRPLNPRVHELLARCVAKDPRRRWQAVGDVRLELEAIAAAPHAQPVGSRTDATALWRHILVYGVPALLVGALIALGIVRATSSPDDERIVRTTIVATGERTLGLDRVLAIAPDGSRVIYVGNNGASLFMRPLDSLQATEIASGRGLRAPFVSPDGNWVAVFDGDQRLLRVPITGGPAIPIVERIDGTQPRGGTWGLDGSIVFATSNTSTGLQRVPAVGGQASVITRADRSRGENDHVWPQVLPGGAVLYTVRSQDDLDEGNVAVLDVATMTQKMLVRGGSYARYVASGHIVYGASGTLRAVAFDLKRLEVRGAPVPVVPAVAASNLGYTSFAVADNGTLVYIEVPTDGTPVGAAPRTLASMDRTGTQQDIPAPPQPYDSPRISPDGMSIAVSSLDQQRDIYVWDIKRGFLRRLTMSPSRDAFPVWTPDGRSVVYASADETGNINLWQVPADGSRPPERLLRSTNIQIPSSITSDGRHVVFHEVMPDTSADLFRVPLALPRTPEALVRTKLVERQGAVSPDGRWLAYEAGGLGATFGIFVRPFASGTQPQWQVSSGGGSKPTWRRNALFYVSGDNALMRVSVPEDATSWNGGNPTRLIDRLPEASDTADFSRMYDVSPDGERFVVVKSAADAPGATAANIIVVQHWIRELADRVPVH
jgi:serine/threonine protein kinase/Tol biopolymer transport system component